MAINCLHSQIQPAGNQQENDKNAISFGVDKILNTFLFKLDGNLLVPTNFGNFSVMQNYKGSALRTLETAFRDDENFFFQYSLPLSKSLFLLATNNWIYSNDSRTIGINEMQRLNGTIGIRYINPNNSSVELSSGLESNSQLGVRSLGPMINLKGFLPHTKLLDVDLAGKVLGEFVYLEDERRNVDLDCELNLQKIYSPEDFLNTFIAYKLLNRDFLSNRGAAELYGTTNQRRLENRVLASGNIGFAFSSEIKSQVEFSFSNLNVTRAYLQPVEDIPFSKVNRILTEMQLSTTGQLFFILEKLSSVVGIAYNFRSEDNAINKKFDISDEEEQMLRQLENQRDNLASRMRFFNKNSFQASESDSVNLEYSVSLMQYNTPSQLNNDDRDEFFTIANGVWTHRFSPFFTASLLGELQMTHLVFLKAQRSALNNWNRVFRINTSFQYNLGSLRINPQFELLANYTVYDFEEVSPRIKSFSFRQISYKDSVMIRLNSNLMLKSKLLFRYFERGILNWGEFKEAPQNSNYEHFINCLLVWSKPDAFEFGCGARWFNLAQKNLTSNTLMNNININQYSVGPETYFIINFSDKTNISFAGWYEFQYINNVYNRGVPNFFLLTKIKF